MGKFTTIFVLGFLLTGCGLGAPSGPSVNPTAEIKPGIKPEITTGDNAVVLQDINTRITQLQESTAIQNYALDSERAENQRFLFRLAFYGGIGALFVVLGFVLLCFFSTPPEQHRRLGKLIGIAFMAGGPLVCVVLASFF